PAPDDLVHLSFRRAGVPRGTGLRVDVASALSLPGVVGAWKAGELALADDFMPINGPPPPARRPVIAFDRVEFEGELVAVVAAETEYAAADAGEAVNIDLLPAEIGPPAELETTYAFGDVSVVGSAPVVVKERLFMARITGAAI